MSKCQDPKFYLCKHCGNLVGAIHRSGVEIVCCGEPMKELVANTSDGAKEKHVPAVTIEGNIVHVKIGEVAHPMTEEHHIEWIYVETKQGGQRKCLCITGAPEADFALTEDDELIAVYEYCNLHGLWKKEM